MDQVAARRPNLCLSSKVDCAFLGLARLGATPGTLTFGHPNAAPWVL